MKQIDTNINFEEYLEFLGKQESDSIVSLETGFEEAMRLIREGPRNTGDTLPWLKTHDFIRFRPSEVTIWAGVNKHGKTELLSNCLIPWAMRGTVVVISLEMPMRALAQRFLQQACACYQPTEERARAAMEMVKHSYLVYDETQSIDSSRILGVIAYAANHLKADHIVVDSLVKCKLSLKQNESSDAQRNFVDKLAWIAKRTQSHIHLVHHMRKGENESKPGNKFDVKGAGELTDMVDNILLVWRNIPKENEIFEMETRQGSPADCKRWEEPDTILTVAGQREGQRQGNIALWFDKDSRRYLGDRREVPKAYV